MASNYGQSFYGPSGAERPEAHTSYSGGPSSRGGHSITVGGPSGSSSHRPSFGGPSSSSQRPAFSFLFVVNKLRILTDDPYVPRPDSWGNALPPFDRHAYTDEEPSRVMRYQGGRVTLAEGYTWHRPHGFHTRGHIFGPSRPSDPQLTRYKVRTVFSCNPFLPIVSAPADMTTHDMNSHSELRWDLLRFEHRTQRHPGVSFAACGQEGHHSQPRQYVAGRNPSWIPSLVPETYLSEYAVPESRGLGGDLPLLLALMSFYHSRRTPHGERMEEVFYGRDALWRDRRWRGQLGRKPKGYSRCEDTPHGFLVHVCLDNVYNTRGSTVEAMRAFEESVIVHDNR